jgi:hypothetical protein
MCKSAGSSSFSAGGTPLWLMPLPFGTELIESSCSIFRFFDAGSPETVF